MSGWTITQHIGGDVAAPSEVEVSASPKFHAKVNHTYKGEPFTLFECVQKVVEDFLSTPLTNRLSKLVDLLEGKDPDLARRIQGIKTEFDKNNWGKASTDDGRACIPAVAFFVDAHIERNLLPTIHRVLFQAMIEALTGANTSMRFQKNMRHAAGLNTELSADTEKFLMQLNRRLFVDDRKKWMNIHAGGSESPLRKYSHALCSHYERLRPVWKDAKKVYKRHGGGASGKEAVERAYQDFSPFIEGTLGARNPKPEHIGLPRDLIAKLEPEREDAKEYDSSPENLAYEHAAFLCGFKVGAYSVKQIKRMISAHKRMLGTEYYNQTFKGGGVFFRDTH